MTSARIRRTDPPGENGLTSRRFILSSGLQIDRDALDALKLLQNVDCYQKEVTTFALRTFGSTADKRDLSRRLVEEDQGRGKFIAKQPCLRGQYDVTGNGIHKPGWRPS